MNEADEYLMNNMVDFDKKMLKSQIKYLKEEIECKKEEVSHIEELDIDKFELSNPTFKYETTDKYRELIQRTKVNNMKKDIRNLSIQLDDLKKKYENMEE